MSQNSVVLPTTGTVSGLQMTQATNNALDTLNTLASGAGAPSSPQAGQLWHDTTNNILKLRSADNTAWISVLNISEAAYLSAPVYTSQITGFVNRIINGGMNIDQVNEGASYSVLTNNTPAYTLDQWVAVCSSATAAGVTAQMVSDAPAGFVKSLKVTVGTGASSVGVTELLQVYQILEANNINDLNLGTASAISLSLGFWVKSSIAGTFAVALYNPVSNRSCVNKFTINSAGVWQYITIQKIPGDQSGTWNAGNLGALNVYFTLAVGSTYQTTNFNTWQAGAFSGGNTQTNSVLTTSGATFQVTGVMLHPGVFTLPFEKRGIQQEIAQCERYYFKTFPSGTAVAQNAGTGGAHSCPQPAGASSAGVALTRLPFRQRMRASPSVTLYNPLAANAQIRNTPNSVDWSSSSAVLIDEAGIGIIGTTPATAVGQNSIIHMTANARM